MSGGHGHIEGSNKKIALLVAVLAAFLAISETGAKSSQTEVLTQHVEATNMWTFFQAKTVRQTVVRTAAEVQGVPTAAEAIAEAFLVDNGTTASQETMARGGNIGIAVTNGAASLSFSFSADPDLEIRNASNGTASVSAQADLTFTFTFTNLANGQSVTWMPFTQVTK